MTPPGDDETRIGPLPGAGSTGSASTTGWLTSSGAIDHGRFPPGTLLGGRYRIVGRLGKGGMGEVFRADDLKLGQPVALKFLPPGVDRDPALLAQLHGEVRMARQVSHPNVCRVYDIDEVDGHTFLSMEFVDGEDLASLLRRIGRFNEERGIEIARQICAGLAAAHQRGVIHRDFKPANVMLDRNGSVRITDFGLAGGSGEKILAGTPAYMAPEQLAGGEVTARSDVYALGLVLYELFTGKRALEGTTVAELHRRREEAAVTPLSAITRDVSPEVDRIVMRCLAIDPAARPASALAVSAALPGGDPLAAALAAGETPSPEMVAAAGETSGLSRVAGMSLLAFIVVGMIAAALLIMRNEVTGRVPLDKSVDVLTESAKNILTLAGYTTRPVDTARGAAFTGEYTNWIAARDQSAKRWDILSQGHAPVLRFWYRTSPRILDPVAAGAWSPQINDPPLDVSGMATVIVDERGRLLELVAMPPQQDKGAAPAPVNWAPFFAAAGLPVPPAWFSEVEPHWTPRVFADSRMAWEGPMPGWPDTTLRVEAAAYAGRPVSFQVVWPWTRPSRMTQLPESSVMRVLFVAGTLFMVALLVGAVALVRFNLRSGRGDRQGAARLALFLIGVWVASWALGARHTFALDVEVDLFFRAVALTLFNVGFTWLFYLGLEPFVRRFCPDMLIGWTRLLRGQWSDPRVGRDLLVGFAAGVFIVLMAAAGTLVSEVASGAQAAPRLWNGVHLFGIRHGVSALLRVAPNALQGAMVATFAYVVLLGLIRSRAVTVGIIGALFVAVLFSEGSGEEAWLTVLFAAVLVVPVLYVFVRFGLLALAAALAANQALQVAPLTLDLTRPYAGTSALCMVSVLAAAAYAFYISRAGNGLFRRFLPQA
ncbi:MAG TPA: serine/threonine-protein kinase [Vicinamibacterales bacterium]|nr:serine/threonine-protein kinase [Vicinamibacterales bacterium]